VPARARRARLRRCGSDFAWRRRRVRRGPVGTPWRRVDTRKHPRRGVRRGARFGSPPPGGGDLVPAAPGFRCVRRRRRLGVCRHGAGNPVCRRGGTTGVGVASTHCGPLGATPVQPADIGPRARAVGSVICGRVIFFRSRRLKASTSTGCAWKQTKPAPSLWEQHKNKMDSLASGKGACSVRCVSALQDVSRRARNIKEGEHNAFSRRLRHWKNKSYTQADEGKDAYGLTSA